MRGLVYSNELGTSKQASKQAFWELLCKVISGLDVAAMGRHVVHNGSGSKLLLLVACAKLIHVFLEHLLR